MGRHIIEMADEVSPLEAASSLVIQHINKIKAQHTRNVVTLSRDDTVVAMVPSTHNKALINQTSVKLSEKDPQRLTVAEKLTDALAWNQLLSEHHFSSEGLKDWWRDNWEKIDEWKSAVLDNDWFQSVVFVVCLCVCVCMYVCLYACLCVSAACCLRVSAAACVRCLYDCLCVHTVTGFFICWRRTISCSRKILSIMYLVGVIMTVLLSAFAGVIMTDVGNRVF